MGAISSWFHSDEQLVPFQMFAGSGRPTSGKVLIQQLEDAAGRGFFFSVNSAMLRSEKGRALIVRMPRERVLTETDGPFIRDGDHPAAPPTVRTTIGSLAKLWHAKPEDVQASVLGNLRYILT